MLYYAYMLTQWVTLQLHTVRSTVFLHAYTHVRVFFFHIEGKLFFFVSWPFDTHDHLTSFQARTFLPMVRVCMCVLCSIQLVERQDLGNRLIMFTEEYGAALFLLYMCVNMPTHIWQLYAYIYNTYIIYVCVCVCVCVCVYWQFISYRFKDRLDRGRN